MKPVLVPLFGLLAVFSSAWAAQELGSEQPPRSGYTFLGPELQALQDDEFSNPGTLWLGQGEELWSTAGPQSQPSCASCHDDAEASMAGVAARYPAFDPEAGHVINLEQQINQCRSERQGLEPLPYESDALLALTLYVTAQSDGMPVDVDIDGPARESYERGAAQFDQRIGQLNMSCRNCHVENVGNRLRGEPISQGQINGFPIYRLLWNSPASTHRMFAWCNEAVRAEPFEAGSQDYVDLELFLKARAEGLAIESPAVRR